MISLINAAFAKLPSLRLQVLFLTMYIYAPFFMLGIYLLGYPNVSVVSFFLYSLMNGYGAGGMHEYEATLDIEVDSSRKIQRHGSDEGHATGRNAPRPNGFMINSRGRCHPIFLRLDT